MYFSISCKIRGKFYDPLFMGILLCQQMLTEDAWRGESQIDIIFSLMLADV